MKFLVLLLLVAACGKESTPPRLDLEDSDGDQVVNHLEVGEDKYIAKTQELPKVEGKMRILNKGTVVFETTITNSKNLNRESLNLLTSSIYTKDEGQYFDEWTKIHLEKKPSSLLKEDLYEVEMIFQTLEKTPSALMYINKENRTKILDWSSKLNFNYSYRELNSILVGESHFSFSSEWLDRPYFFDGKAETALKERTYRVFYYNGIRTQILYVSKELSFTGLLGQLGITHYTPAEKDDLFALGEKDNEERWWTREVNSTLKVIAKSHPIIVKNTYLEKMLKSQNMLQRLNGQEANLNFKKEPNAKFFVKIRGSKIDRSFYLEEKNTEYFVARGEYSRECKIRQLNLTGEHSIPLSENDLRSSLRINVDGLDVNLNSAIHAQKGIDAEGEYWSLGFDYKGESIKVTLLQRAQNTYQSVGVHWHNCLGSAKPKEGTVLLNNEKQMDLKIESFIEKI